MWFPCGLHQFSRKNSTLFRIILNNKKKNAKKTNLPKSGRFVGCALFGRDQAVTLLK